MLLLDQKCSCFKVYLIFNNVWVFSLCQPWHCETCLRLWAQYCKEVHGRPLLSSKTLWLGIDYTVADHWSRPQSRKVLQTPSISWTFLLSFWDRITKCWRTETYNEAFPIVHPSPLFRSQYTSSNYINFTNHTYQIAHISYWVCKSPSYFSTS